MVGSGEGTSGFDGFSDPKVGLLDRLGQDLPPKANFRANFDEWRASRLVVLRLCVKLNDGVNELSGDGRAFGDISAIFS